jgi:hypothetical protein
VAEAEDDQWAIPGLSDEEADDFRGHNSAGRDRLDDRWALFAKPGHPLLMRYRSQFQAAPIVLSFITVAELRYGAYKGGWGKPRLEALEERFRRVSAVVVPDNDLVEQQARLRVQCHRIGHGLHDKVHEADRWIQRLRSGTACRLSRTMRSLSACLA